MAFAVPSGAALDLIARHAPIVEMGAGTGFWVSLLRSRGLDATAFDVQPPRRPDDRTAHRVGGMEASKISEMKDMAEENRRLKRMYAEMGMQNDLLKEALGKKR